MITSNTIKKLKTNFFKERGRIIINNSDNQSHLWYDVDGEIKTRNLMIRFLLSLWLFTFVINILQIIPFSN